MLVIWEKRGQKRDRKKGIGVLEVGGPSKRQRGKSRVAHTHNRRGQTAPRERGLREGRESAKGGERTVRRRASAAKGRQKD